MSSEVIITLVGLFCTTVSSIVTFILTRRKYNTEVDSQQIENMEKSFDAYKKMMEETLEAQKKLMETTVNGLNNKIDTLEKENTFLRQQVDSLRAQMIQFLGVKFSATNSHD
jgi:septal ring factor EnvC (AmiA/AmiB activator)